MSKVFRVKKVPLLRGLRWAGKIKILSVSEAGVVVEFDAQVVKTGTWVYDLCTLSPEQFKDWTGKDIHDLLG